METKNPQTENRRFKEEVTKWPHLVEMVENLPHVSNALKHIGEITFNSNIDNLTSKKGATLVMLQSGYIPRHRH